ncbi:MAG: alpha/beta hydrolase [Betaproteobacteria bacterium]|nr:MAG: alpha/beta hydrolase [Betaproteobacteria bacterium]
MQRRTWVFGLAATASGLLSGCVEGMFFHPDRLTYATPAALGVTARDVYFATDDGATLHGWWLPATGAARATLVHAHGNAANISNHLPLVAWLPAAGIDVLTFDYRGFGRSTGTPTLDGVVADMRAAFAEARRRATAHPLVLLGQSLGGATAIRALAQDAAAGANDVKLLICDSAFSSYRGIAREAASGSVLSVVAPFALPTLPAATSDPLNAITSLRAPLLLLHGELDQVIAIRHSERLHAAATSPKQFVRIKDGQHIDALQRPDIRDRVLASIANSLGS